MFSQIFSIILLKSLFSVLAQVNSCTEYSELQFNTKPPKSKVSRSLLSTSIENMSLHLIHPVELARQLALIHHHLYRAIRVEEVLHMRWTKNDKLEKSPNVIASIHHFCEYVFIFFILI